ncbi:DUF732 domain-containing protein [Mycobacterium fragae]|uniref:DUF732 domain-containing protein n=1 Tax=Mycobacterium fragae TaxID=1260918 RepID=UPI00111C3CCE|nr:DUF732 domain-containing protein [Mycobacterium fragae]MCV7401295.1 DUF732 domain-containing protein [Mycobacterium fragae]
MQTTAAIRLVAGSATLACLLMPVTPAPARAEENSFLAQVHGANMPLTDAKALKLGHATCTDLGNGIAMSAILESNSPAVGGSPSGRVAFGNANFGELSRPDRPAQHG